MLKSLVKSVFNSLGYDVVRADGGRHSSFTLHEYRKPDGTFDYEKYRKIQNDGNRSKIGKVFVLEDNIKFLSDYIISQGLAPVFGICHGTRRGKEQEWFRKYLGCDVIGTEISDSAGDFSNTIQWDFHDTKPEWIDAVDFIYSNAFDHSYDPDHCLNTWMSCLRPGGLCFLEHSTLHGPTGASELDPFGAELEIMPYLITTWARGKFFVRQILEAPAKSESLQHLHFIVIQKDSLPGV